MSQINSSAFIRFLVTCAALAIFGGSRASAQPGILLNPSAMSLEVGETVTISVDINTNGSPVRGGAVRILYDAGVFAMPGGAASIVPGPGSPFSLTPPPFVGPGRIDIPFLNQDFSLIEFIGTICFFQLQAIQGAQQTVVGFDPAFSRFAPNIDGTVLVPATLSIEGSGPTPTPEETAEPTPEETPTWPPTSCPPDTLLHTLDNPRPVENDYFAGAVAVSGDLAVIGARGDSGGTGTQGTAYVFNATSGTLATTLTNPYPQPGDDFGRSVSISGNLAVIGAPGIGSGGRAFVFDAATGALVQGLNNPVPLFGDGFGSSVAVSGNMAVVGLPGADSGGISSTGRAVVFHSRTGILLSTLNNPAPSSGDYFGSSVAISGLLAVVGAPGDNPGGLDFAGTAYVFDAATGDLTAILNNPAPRGGDIFGGAVAISGNMAVVGVPQTGAASPPFVGVAYVFNVTSGSLVAALTNTASPAFGGFGGDVAIHGNIAIVGAPGDNLPGSGLGGAAHVFNATTGALTATLGNPAPDMSDRFGISVAVSGTLAVVGAAWDDPAGVLDAGTAYVFSRTPPAAPRDILDNLLGRTEAATDLDSNCDDAVDAADLILAIPAAF